jgi:16S rRNA (adenine1518-N6/adenine1519-N6)-dimethyltransferase
VVDEQAFSELVRTAFSQRRKTVRNALKHYQPENAFAICGIDPQVRPEMLSAEDFANLTAVLSDSPAACRTGFPEDVR